MNYFRKSIYNKDISDDEVLNVLSGFVRVFERLQVRDVVLFVVESHIPLATASHAFGVMCAPLLQIVFGERGVHAILRMLESRELTEAFCMMLRQNSSSESV